MPNNKSIIILEDLLYTYPDGTQALKGINLEICKGDFIALLGPNGSGKSTLVKHFNGLLKPTKGRVIVDGIDTKDITTAQLAKKVGYVFQNPDHQIFAEKLYDELAFGLRNLKFPENEIKKRVEEAARFAGLSERLDDFPFFMSTGERKRLTIASIISMNPEVIILDEPTTGQDYKNCKNIMNLIKELHKQGKTIILITHDMNIVGEYCEKLVLLNEGKVMKEGTTKEIFANDEVLEKSSLTIPQITQLAQKLKTYRIPSNICSIDEMKAEMLKLVGSKIG